MDKTAKVVAAIAGVAVVGGLAYVAVTHGQGPSPPPPGQQLAGLALSAASLSIAENQEDEVTVVARDSTGNPIAGVSGILLQVNGQSAGTFPATDSTGLATLAVSFPAAGSYVLVAEK